ncbi:MAG: hypothetical protein E2592_01285 [Methylobacillus sp.]|nr:hypothetical protein [Methylobacillus sp.]
MRDQYIFYVAGTCSLIIHAMLVCLQTDWMISKKSIEKANMHNAVMRVQLKEEKINEFNRTFNVVHDEENQSGEIDQGQASLIKARNHQHGKLEELPELTTVFYSSEEVDRKAVPISNLDISMMNGWYSGLPIRLRLYIDSDGRVREVVQFSDRPEEKEFIAQLTQLLSHMRFIPAKINGHDVNSYQDVEFSF